MPTSSPERVRGRQDQRLPPATSVVASGGPGSRSGIARSWERCADRGMRAEQAPTDQYLPVDAGSRLVRSAAPVLAALESALADDPVGVLLCDHTGTVVAARGIDRDVRRALDAAHLVPGFSAAEAVVGTNGVGLALVEDRPWLVRGDEHYWAPLTGFVCAGAPIHDTATGAVVGGLALGTPATRHSPMLLALACQTAGNVEGRFATTDPVPRARPLPPLLRLSPMEVLERDAIADALARHADVAAAADHLGLSRATVYRKIKRYRLRATAP